MAADMQMVRKILTAYTGAEFSLNGSSHVNTIEGVIDNGDGRFSLYLSNVSRLIEYDLRNGEFKIHARDIKTITYSEFQHFVTTNFITDIKYYRTPSTSYRIDRYTDFMEMHIGTNKHGAEMFVRMTDFNKIQLVAKVSSNYHLYPEVPIRAFADYFRPKFDLGFGIYKTLPEAMMDIFGK